MHHRNKTTSGLGEFEGVFYSKEIKHALTLGYKIDVINGYYFTDSIKIFTDYVESLYEIRKSYDKNEPMNYVAKLLMNSLYGKMAQDDRHDAIKVFTQEEFNKFSAKTPKNRIKEVIKLDDKFVVQYKLDRCYNQFNSNYENHFSSIPIATAITAEARIFMSKFKNNPNFKLYYTDTDSIFVDKSPEEMNNIIPGIINNDELGKLKHEFTVKRAVFLGPKCYWLQLVDGSEIIKIKGVKKEFIDKAREKGLLTINLFENLLNKNTTLSIEQEKWFRSLPESTINIALTSYAVKQSENKRELVYEYGKCVSTRPFIFKKEEFRNDMLKKYFK